jgi:hypothetical protein
MNRWRSTIVKAAPIGTAAFAALVFTAASFPLFHLFGHAGVVFVIVSYLLFPPAVLCSVYSVLFEKSKMFGWAGLAVLAAMFTQRSMWILFDGLLLLPLYVLVMALVIKIVGRRRAKAQSTSRQLQS